MATSSPSVKSTAERPGRRAGQVTVTSSAGEGGGLTCPGGGEGVGVGRDGTSPGQRRRMSGRRSRSSTVRERVSSTSARRAAISSAVAVRRAGSRSSAERTMVSRAGGTFSFQKEGGTMRSGPVSARSVATSLSRAKRRWPVQDSQRTTPSAKMSARASAGASLACSGAM